MKRILSLLLVLCMMLSLVACGVTEETPGSVADGNGGDTTVTSEETAPQQDSTGGDTKPVDSEISQGTTSPTVKPSEPESTQPSAGAIIATTPGNAQSAQCTHTYKLTSTKASTCIAAGSKTYTCSQCQNGYTEALALAEHKYGAASCTKPQTCSVCSNTTGDALGHSYGANNLCIRCSQKADPVEFKATVCSDKNVPIKGVTVNIYTDASGNTPAGSGVTNDKGVALIAVDGSSKYRIILTNVPKGYQPKESYECSSTTFKMTVTTMAVRDPLDHSRAQYKIGDIMEDFTLTDTDGNTYRLSKLMQQKKLIILDFWYVNCGPCKGEFPYFEAALGKYGEDIALLALNSLDSEESIKELRSEMGVGFPMIRESIGLTAGFGVTAYPTTVLISSDGKIQTIHKGAYKSEADFLNAIEKYL